MKDYFENRISEIISPTNNNPNIDVDILNHYPKYLYKYRDCKEEYNFQMIQNSYLWANTPENFSDPFDSLVYLKFDNELPLLQEWLYKHIGEIIYYSIPPQGMEAHKNGQTLQLYKEHQQRFFDSSGNYSAKKAKQLMSVEMNKMNQNDRTQMKKLLDKMESKEFKEMMNEAITTDIKNIINALRHNNMVFCLTERKDNSKMWEDYGDVYSGFVVEYNLNKVYENTECLKTIYNMFPVTYYKRMPKVPLLPFIQKSFYKKLYNKDISIKDDEKKLFKQLIIKKHDYSNEEEWRIISSEQKIDFPIISAVYAGCKISDDNLNRLKTICKTKGILLYKQVLTLSGDIRFNRINL